jgi:hypothetical protein
MNPPAVGRSGPLRQGTATCPHGECGAYPAGREAPARPAGASHLPEGFIAPWGFEAWNRALRGAYVKGWRAHMAGDSPGAYPYRDSRTSRGAITWSRSFIRAWLDGWDAAERLVKASSHNRGHEHG